MLDGTKSDSVWAYTADILKQSNIITEIDQRLLIENLKKTKHYTNFSQYNDLFNKVKKVTTMDDLLQIKPGELVVFTEALPNPSRPAHTMVNIGNGRFAGIKNSLLDVNLGDGKKIITATQLGQFNNGVLKQNSSLNSAGLNVWAGYPQGAKYSYGQPIEVVAKKLAAESIANSASIHYF
ncbi:MAG: hypothetical protein AB8W37_04025 [Arsenophonus endosymbiont of Dermacentor nuttalli]